VQYLELGIRCLIGAVFLASSVSKTAGRKAFDAFVASVQRLGLLPARLCRATAIFVVVAEYAVWVLLAVGYTTTAVAGFLMAAGLLLMFAAAIFLVVRRGVHAPCRCFGASTTPLGTQHFVRNAALAAVACTGVVTASATGPLELGGSVVSVLSGLMLGGLIALFDDIYELFQPVRSGPDVARDFR
jgi:uncharacterized membrane protein YphA (DoxX/SURF4 family)